jgi:hypothetical protein
MRTILDVDYHDDCLFGNGDLDSLWRMFTRAAGAGIDTILWAPMVCGKAHYPSKIATQIGDSRTHPGSHFLAELKGKFDPLEKAVELSREFGMELLFYFRLFDDFYPGLEEDYLDTRPDLWWQSRCGHFYLRGWPSYHQAEVRAYKMRLFQEMLAYGPDGFMVEVGRSHSMYANAPRAANFFGYESPVAQEYSRRYGVDISAYDYANGVSNSEGVYRNVPFTYEFEYSGAAEFDLDAWHWLKGEVVDSFLRDLRAAAPQKKLLLQSGVCPPHPAALHEECAKFYLDANALAADNIIDGFSLSNNFKATPSRQIEAFFFPYFQGVREAGKPVGVWLKDIVTADGGHGEFAPLENVAAYIERVLDTNLDYAVIHEADFLTRHQNSDAAWQLMRAFKSADSQSTAFSQITNDKREPAMTI